jgi:Tol biopolymer transport system component
MSPDSGRVLFRFAPGNGRAERGTDKCESAGRAVRIWGSRPVRRAGATDTGEKGESSPAWSPDGRYISFTAIRGGGAPSGASTDAEGPKEQIWLMRADGGEAWQLTDGKESVSSYEWAPNSRQIAYLMREPLSKDADEARRRKDDERVFETDPQMQHLWVVDVESKAATAMTSGGDFGIRSLTWSPDSTRIAAGVSITQLARDERQDIQIITIATKERQPIAATPAIESNPRWSPDGATIAYTMVAVGDAKTNGDGLMTRPLFNARLMLYDVASKRSRMHTTRHSTIHSAAPRGRPTAARLLFGLGDRVYRSMFSYDVASGRFGRLTDRQMISFEVGGARWIEGSRHDGLAVRAVQRLRIRRGFQQPAQAHDREPGG